MTNPKHCPQDTGNETIGLVDPTLRTQAHYMKSWSTTVQYVLAEFSLISASCGTDVTQCPFENEFQSCHLLWPSFPLRNFLTRLAQRIK